MLITLIYAPFFAMLPVFTTQTLVAGRGGVRGVTKQKRACNLPSFGASLPLGLYQILQQCDGTVMHESAMRDSAVTSRSFNYSAIKPHIGLDQLLNKLSK